MTIEERRGLGIRTCFGLALVALLVALALQASRSTADTFTEPNVTATFTNVTGLDAGDLVEGSITTTNGFGGFEVKLCKSGFTSWSLTNYGYSGSTGNRCVKQAAPGGLNPPDGGLDFDAATPGIQPPPVTNPSTGGYWIPTVAGSNNPETRTFQFRAGTGTAEWFNTDGFGPFSITCDATNPCAMVVRVSHGGANTFFTQPLNYEGSGTPTTTTPATTTPPTTTPATTTPPTTTPATTVPIGGTPTTTGSVTPTTPGGGSGTGGTGTGGGSGTGGTGGTLRFTGGSTRDLLSIGLVVLAVGLFAVGEAQRRRLRA